MPGKTADLQSTVALPFVPVVEPDVPGAFLTKRPRESLPGIDVPLLTGFNAQEGIILFRRKLIYNLFTVHTLSNLLSNLF